MRRSQIEAWALEVIERVEQGKPNEDASVELKSNWIEPADAAHRIGGHANAARGEPILWLIGVDEKRGVVGAPREELANWFPAVEKHFDGNAPTYTDVNLVVGDKVVVALLFETDYLPFVIKNPQGGALSHYVPWRTATRTRTAKRNELLRMLVPVLKTPAVEWLNGHLQATLVNNGLAYSWQLSLVAYLTPRTRERVVLPFHRCHVTIEIVGHTATLVMEGVSLVPSHQLGVTAVSRTSSRPSIPLGMPLVATGDELLIDGPGKIMLYAGMKADVLDSTAFAQEIVVRGVFLPIDADVPITMTTTMRPAPGTVRMSDGAGGFTEKTVAAGSTPNWST